MVNYVRLHEYFTEQKELHEITKEAGLIEIVSGFLISVHPLWIVFKDVEEGIINGSSDQVLSDLIASQQLNASLSSIEAKVSRNWPGWYRDRSLWEAPKGWEDYLNLIGQPDKRSPLVMTIVFRSPAPPLIGSEDESQEEQVIQLLNLARRHKNHFVQVEERPMASLCGVVGKKLLVQNRGNGTLGGYVTNTGDGSKLGLTCAHVCGAGDNVSIRNSTLGLTCVVSADLFELPSGASKDPLQHTQPNPYPGNGPVLNMIDCALIQTNSVTSASPLSGVISALSTGMRVRAYGAKTSLQYRLGSLAISYTFQRKNRTYLFKDAIELIPEAKVPVGGKLNTLMSSAPVDGDSGSWVLTGSNSEYWAAMLFGTDGARGFAVRSNWIVDWASSQIGHHVSI